MLQCSHNNVKRLCPARGFVSVFRVAAAVALGNNSCSTQPATQNDHHPQKVVRAPFSVRCGADNQPPRNPCSSASASASASSLLLRACVRACAAEPLLRESTPRPRPTTVWTSQRRALLRVVVLHFVRCPATPPPPYQSCFASC